LGKYYLKDKTVKNCLTKRKSQDRYSILINIPQVNGAKAPLMGFGFYGDGK
jgi:hypothetical protein